MERYREILSAFDLSRFPKLDKAMLRQVGVSEWRVLILPTASCVSRPACCDENRSGDELCWFSTPAPSHHALPQVDDALSLDLPALMRQMVSDQR